jgi:type I restriction enzyme R subunit
VVIRCSTGPRSPGELGAERADYTQVVLEGRLRQALVQLNPTIPSDALEDAFRQLTRADAPTALDRNRALHRMLVVGVTV